MNINFTIKVNRFKSIDETELCIIFKFYCHYDASFFFFFYKLKSQLVVIISFLSSTIQTTKRGTMMHVNRIRYQSRT